MVASAHRVTVPWVLHLQLFTCSCALTSAVLSSFSCAGSSPALPQAGVVLPGFAGAAAGGGGGSTAAAAAAPGAAGLQHYNSGPLLSAIGLSPGGVFQAVGGLQGSGGLGVQGFAGNGGLGDGLDDDEGMMDV